MNFKGFNLTKGKMILQNSIWIRVHSARKTFFGYIYIYIYYIQYNQTYFPH